MYYTQLRNLYFESSKTAFFGQKSIKLTKVTKLKWEKSLKASGAVANLPVFQNPFQNTFKFILAKVQGLVKVSL